jgi:group I intron endonuclease
MKFTIYKYTCPENKIYIGLTINPKNRQRDHQAKEKESSRDNSKFAQAIRKFGFSNFKYEEIEYPNSVIEMKEREQYWIKMFNSFESGYNSDLVGTWTQSFTYEVETVEKIITALKDETLSQTQIAEMFGVSPGWISDIKRGNKRNISPIHRRNYQSQKGSNNKLAKLTEAQVAEIRALLSTNTPRRDIATQFNISKTLVQLIATNGAWSHVSTDYQYKPKETNGNAKLTAEIVAQIKKDLQELPQTEVAAKYSISRSTVQQIAYNKTWKNVFPAT